MINRCRVPVLSHWLPEMIVFQNRGNTIQCNPLILLTYSLYYVPVSFPTGMPPVKSFKYISIISKLIKYHFYAVIGNLFNVFIPVVQSGLKNIPSKIAIHSAWTMFSTHRFQYIILCCDPLLIFFLVIWKLILQDIFCRCKHIFLCTIWRFYLICIIV